MRLHFCSHLCEDSRVSTELALDWHRGLFYFALLYSICSVERYTEAAMNPLPPRA